MSDATDFSLVAIQPQHLAAYLQRHELKTGKVFANIKGQWQPRVKRFGSPIQ